MNEFYRIVELVHVIFVGHKWLNVWPGHGAERG
jgi:hypothetical protein